jgi:hypothetical protein
MFARGIRHRSSRLELCRLSRLTQDESLDSNSKHFEGGRRCVAVPGSGAAPQSAIHLRKNTRFPQALFAGRAGVHVDFHAYRHFDDSRSLPGHFNSPSRRGRQIAVSRQRSSSNSASAHSARHQHERRRDFACGLVCSAPVDKPIPTQHSPAKNPNRAIAAILPCGPMTASLELALGFGAIESDCIKR